MRTLERNHSGITVACTIGCAASGYPTMPDRAQPMQANVSVATTVAQASAASPAGAIPTPYASFPITSSRSTRMFGPRASSNTGSGDS
jgi:hypothetical protein